jgi:hypothetical protein
MLIGFARGLVVTVAALWLAGCTTSTSFSNLFGSRPPSDEASAAQANAETSEPEKPIDETTTGTVPPPLGARATAPGLLGSDPYDELSLGKKYYRSNNYGIAEKHSAVPSSRIRATRRHGSALPRPMIACAVLILLTAPMVRRSASLDRRPRF